MTRILPAILFLILGAGPSWAAARIEAVFTSLSGSVTVKTRSAPARPAKTGVKLVEGDLVMTGKDSRAEIRSFDGTTIQVKSQTKFRLTRMRKPTANDTEMKVGLDFGELVFNVRKLFSKKSSFEVKAGGVVCGVRGTSFSVLLDPKTSKAILKVLEGTVWTKGKDGIKDHGPGSVVNFLKDKIDDGKPKSPPAKDQGDKDEDKPKGKGDKGKGNKDKDALKDLKNHLGRGLGNGQDNTLTDPSVEGSIRVNIRLNTPPLENLP